jgi:tetratricopeptide (TPR) repeat protein
MRPANPTLRPISPGLPRFWTPCAVLAIFGATLAAYLPAVNGGMLWDDAAHVTGPRLRTWDGLRRIWLQPGTTQQYYPVLHSAFWTEHRLWGDSVLGYHLVNIGLHATAACLFALVLQRIRPESDGRRRLPGIEWLAAAVFALHPICVESVAWISEQKNTLSLVFYLLAALAYLRFDRERGGKWYAIGFGLFILALLSKTVTATLPGALLVALAWRRGRLSFRRDAVPLLPWFAIGASAGLFTAWVERHFIGAQGLDFDLTLLERCLLAGRIFWFYVGKLLWPVNLSFIYPRWHVVPAWRWSVGILSFAAALAALWRIRKWSPAPLLALLFFAGSLLPALGFFNVYPFLFSYVADHFQYQACLGIIALAAVGGPELVLERARGLDGPLRRVSGLLLSVAAAAVLAALFAITWRQSAHYRDPVALYSDTLAKNPDSWMAHNNLGKYLMDSGSPDSGVAHVREALRLRPDYAQAHSNLGVYLMHTGSPSAGIAEFEAALRIEPALVQSRENLGLALLDIPGRSDEGIELLEGALRDDADDPGLAEFHDKLGATLARIPGRMPDAVSELEKAVQIEPGRVSAHGNLGNALARSGRSLEAIQQFEWAIRIQPGDPRTHNNLGIVLAGLGRLDEAMAQFRMALHLSPGFSEAHYNLGLALRQAGRPGEAAAEFSASGRPQP